jgi:GTP cyclohydrolase II
MKSHGMPEAQAEVNSALFGGGGHTSVSRGLGELHGRRPVLVTASGSALLVLPVEGLDEKRLAEFRALCGNAEIRLVVTDRRARTLGIAASTPMEMPLSAVADARTIVALVTDATSDHVPHARPATSLATAAIQLVKLSQSLPAVLAAEATAGAIASDEGIMSVQADAIACFAEDAIGRLIIASEASVPLTKGLTARFVVFRDAMGGSPVAVIIGTPDFGGAVPVRLHSACLTGDVFGSRRCDCGDQLRLALTRLEDLGGGIILYLAQEGRGLGLANKMRAYQLQDNGLDTIDANTTLGFDDDERDYGVAARMLQMLNYTRIALLTNNPAKLDGLARAGIDIASRMSLEAPINADNRRYMTAKAARSGHRLDHLMNSLADLS